MRRPSDQRPESEEDSVFSGGLDAWLDLARAGDERAFRVLHRMCRERVHRQVMAFCQDLDVADDLTQDVFIRAFGSLKSFRGEASLTRWLCRITSNRIKDFVRRERRSGQTSMDHPGVHSRRVAERDIPLLLTLRGAIDSLPKIYRDTLVLYDIEGYPHPQIARRLKVREGTCRARLSRARALVRESLVHPGNDQGRT